MDYKVAGYVKLAKLWEKKEDSAIAYHKKYYAAKFDGVDGYTLVDVYIDITGKKEICKRLEMVRLVGFSSGHFFQGLFTFENAIFGVIPAGCLPHL